MLSNWIYWLLGNPELTPDKTGDEDTVMYKTDPYYMLLIIFPFWAALLLWAPAALSSLALILGVLGWIDDLLLVKVAWTAGFWWIAGLPFFLLSYTVLQYYWITIPDPYSAARQAFTKKTRYLRNGMVLIKWLGMKSWILPGSARLVSSADKPGAPGKSIETWIRQEGGGTDRQFVKLQIKYNLDAHNFPRRIQTAFLDQFIGHRLERAVGDSWLAKIQNATNGTMEEIDKEVIDRLAGMADAVLASVVIEELIGDRERINDEFKAKAKQKFMDEYGIFVDSVSVEDVQDVRPEGGWITEKSRASQAQQTSLADQVAANAAKDAEIVQAQAFQAGQEAVLAAQAAVAEKQVLTTEEQIKAEAKIAELKLQQVKASLDLLGTTDDSASRAFKAAVLDKLTKLEPTEAIAVWNGLKDVLQAGATAMKGPETLVVGMSGAGELRNVQPTPVIDLLAQMFGIQRPNQPPTTTTP